MTDEEFLERAGFDAYMLMRLPFFALRFCFYTFTPCGMIAVAIPYWMQQKHGAL